MVPNSQLTYRRPDANLNNDSSECTESEKANEHSIVRYRLLWRSLKPKRNSNENAIIKIVLGKVICNDKHSNNLITYCSERTNPRKTKGRKERLYSLDFSAMNIHQHTRVTR